MIIREFSTNQFAGINNQMFKFEENLNVVLGPNEAGKSTVVNAIVATLFNKIKVGDRNKEDVIFKERFMPHPSGDNIDGKITIEVAGDKYLLQKEWGVSPSIKLTCPDNLVIKDEGAINEKLKELMKFGESTYKRIVFSKQEELKDAFNIMTSDESAIFEIGDFLRKSVMELNGVSLDELENKLDLEIEELYKKWDIDKNYPDNNRGINNPYKVGMGKLLISFYEKEELLKSMSETKVKELDLEEAYKNLKANEETTEGLKLRKKELEIVESDIRKISQLEPEKKLIEDKIKILKEIHDNWPKKQSRLLELEKEINEVNAELEKLDKEKDLASKADDKLNIENKIKSANEQKQKIEGIQNLISEITVVTDDDIAYLDKTNLEVEKIQATLNVGYLTGKVINLPDSMEIYIKEDGKEAVTVSQDEEFQANGLVTIGNNSGLEIRITSGKENLEESLSRLKAMKDEIEARLSSLNVDSIEMAKEKYKTYARLSTENINLKTQLELLLGGNTLEELEIKFESLNAVTKTRDIMEIKAEITSKNVELIKKGIEENTIKNNLEEWELSHSNIENLFDEIIDVTVLLKEKTKELVSLNTLPTEFSSNDAYFNALDNTRTEFEKFNELYSLAKEKYYESERDLPETSFEELEKEYGFISNKYNKLLEKGKRLTKVKDTFILVKERMDQDTNRPLIDAMEKYLKHLTQGSYNISEITSSLSLKIKNQNSANFPINLLSAGTKDSASLALRLSLAETIQGNDKGLLVLDDCLVDMDPIRKKSAIEMIKLFSKNHQVIFTTCNPDTAMELEGNIIKMNSITNKGGL